MAVERHMAVVNADSMLFEFFELHVWNIREACSAFLIVEHMMRKYDRARRAAFHFAGDDLIYYALTGKYDRIDPVHGFGVVEHEAIKRARQKLWNGVTHKDRFVSGWEVASSAALVKSTDV